MNDVSGATSSNDTARATLLASFPHAGAALERYADVLATSGVERGLIGPREADRLWDRHLANCAALAALVPSDSTVADIGSGAGLPGIVLALVRPDLRVTLVEPLLRRTTFLEDAVRELALGARVSVCRERAESMVATFDVVTARAVAPLDRLLTLCLPLLRPGGVLLALKGTGAADEVASAAATLASAGVTDVEVRQLETAGAPTTVVRLTAAAS